MKGVIFDKDIFILSLIFEIRINEYFINYGCGEEIFWFYNLKVKVEWLFCLKYICLIVYSLI